MPSDTRRGGRLTPSSGMQLAWLTSVLLFAHSCRRGQEPGLRSCRTEGTHTSAGKSVPAAAPEFNNLRLAARTQLEYCERMAPHAEFVVGHRLTSVRKGCVKILRTVLRLSDSAVDEASLIRELRTELDWHEVKRPVRVTGYYTPLVEGSITRDSEYRYPIYAMPSDPTAHTRREIDWEGALANRGLELLYLKKRFDAYLLHLEGSGLVLLRTPGGVQHKLAAFGGTNGRGYTSVGAVMKREGIAPAYLTIQGMRRYFDGRPDEQKRLLSQNQRYIFFELSKGAATGIRGLPLTPEVSIAADGRYYSPGAVAIIRTRRPRVKDGAIVEWVPFERIVIVQDRGGAIKGAGRIDYYWGTGEYAEIAAGSMSEGGEIAFALPPG